MEKLRRTVKEIAFVQDHAKLSTLHRSLIPFLSFASSLFRVALSLRHFLYRSGTFSKHRLPVPVISVGNLTWGGNGKTPMVEFIAKYLADCGISPLILTRGYAGGDEAKMLRRHLIGVPAKIGVGANRAATADGFFKKYGYVDYGCKSSERKSVNETMRSHLGSEKIGAAILDDGMQHWSLCRDLEIVMVNGLMPWGNLQLLPLGPLREPLMALGRADVAVIHHADLVLEQNLKDTELMMQGAVCNSTVLCVSAIGSPHAFVQQMEKMGALYVDQLDFSDHHSFEVEDIWMMRMQLRQLEDKFCCKPIVVVTEKDYDRDPEILKHLNPFEVLALCSELQFISNKIYNEDYFKNLLRKLVE
ncbi:hypothetical protein SLA2020_476970 [Shorea laevis]